MIRVGDIDNVNFGFYENYKNVLIEFIFFGVENPLL